MSDVCLDGNAAKISLGDAALVAPNSKADPDWEEIFLFAAWTFFACA